MKQRGMCAPWLGNQRCFPSSEIYFLNPALAPFSAAQLPAPLLILPYASHLLSWLLGALFLLPASKSYDKSISSNNLDSGHFSDEWQICHKVLSGKLQ